MKRIMLRNNPYLNVFFCASVVLYLMFFMHLMMFNPGGRGLYLPGNIIAWGWAGFVCALIWLLRIKAKPNFSNSFRWLFLACFLFSLPLFKATSMDAFIVAYPQILAIWVGCFFYFSINQVRLTEKQLTVIFLAFSFSGLVESILVYIGIFIPSVLPDTQQILIQRYGNAVGVFQQANVTASFLASTLGCMLYQLAINKSAYPIVRLRKIKDPYLALTLIVTLSALVLTQSRIGMLSSFLTAGLLFLLLLCHRRLMFTTPFRCFCVGLVYLCGVTLGWFLLKPSLSQAFTHAGSNHQRILTLWNTWELIKENPFRGYGLGMFGTVFQRFMSDYPVNPSTELMAHPHNEILYLWLEGGVLAVIAMVALFIFGCLLISQSKTMIQYILLLTTVPILLHTQVEFPFYSSAPHLLITILFLAMCENCSGQLVVSDQPATLFYKRCSIIISLVAFTATIFIFSCLYPAKILTSFELQKINNPELIKELYVPFIMQERYKHDLMLLKLVEFKKNPNEELLNLFVTQNRDWLRYHSDTDMFYNQYRILIYLGRYDEAYSYKFKAEKQFPWDPRF